MIIVYTPAAGEPEQYDARTLLASEASIVARTIDMKWPQVKEGLSEDDLDAMRAVVWVLKKRHAATLRYGDFDPGVDELVTRFDKTEVENWVDAGFALRAKNPDMTLDQVVTVTLVQVEALAADPEHARAYIEKCRAEAERGKGPAPAEEAMAVALGLTSSTPSTSPTPEPSTSDSSPTS